MAKCFIRRHVSKHDNNTLNIEITNNSIEPFNVKSIHRSVHKFIFDIGEIRFIM